MTVLKTIDAHVGGEPLRMVVDGFPAPRGSTMAEKRKWASRNVDHLRRLVMLEPRGHSDMCGAVLTEPTSPGSHAGILFMDNQGFNAMSGHGVIAAVTIALERGLLVPGGDGCQVTLDTPAGSIRVVAERGTRVERVSFVNVPSFVLQGGVSVTLGGRRLRADIAFGGAFFAIVDSEAVGLPLDAFNLPQLRRAAMDIKRAIEVQHVAAHPVDPHLSGIYGTIFTGPARDGVSDLRNVTVFANGAVDRSSCGTGTAAVMAVIEAMGLLDDSRAFVHESILGTTLQGRVVGRTIVGDYPAIVPEIHGSAWITGEHTFFVHPDDPLESGFQLT